MLLIFKWKGFEFMFSIIKTQITIFYINIKLWMSENSEEQYNAILKSVLTEKQYSLYCGKDDRLADIAKFLVDLQTIPNVTSE